MEGNIYYKYDDGVTKPNDINTMILTLHLLGPLYTAYESLKREREDARASHRTVERRGRSGPIRFHYPEHLATPFPTFGGRGGVKVNSPRNLRRDEYLLNEVLVDLTSSRTIRKDNSEFWTVKFDARDDAERHNPYVFPSAVSHVCSLLMTNQSSIYHD